jgi:hypothetical protein
MKAVMTLEERQQSDAKKSVITKDTLEKKYIRCFKLGSKVYVPTYTSPSLGGIEYVGPESNCENGFRYSEIHLLSMGAVPTKELLWIRPYLEKERFK